jgi:MFS family permease
VSTRALHGSEKRAVALLGVPTLALALASTVVTTYSPVVASDFVGSTAVIGVIIGLEGLVALWLPLVVGSWSDRLDTRLGGRLPFLLGATPAIVAGLAALALMKSTLVLAAGALLFFVGYFVAYEPYRALYPDSVGSRTGHASGLAGSGYRARADRRRPALEPRPRRAVPGRGRALSRRDRRLHLRARASRDPAQRAGGGGRRAR